MDSTLAAVGANNNIRIIIVVEDAADNADSIRDDLEHQGFRVEIANSAHSTLDLILDHPSNPILFDFTLPGMNGFELCRRLCAVATTVSGQILMLTARNGESDKMLGIELGADDYLTKPFSMRELHTQVNAILRRTNGSEDEPAVYDNGVLVIDPWTFSVRYEGREVRLTRKEMKLLQELARNEGRVIMREILLDRIWGLRSQAASRTLDVHISRLRMKLGNSDIIETITGIGYRLIGSHAKSE